MANTSVYVRPIQDGDEQSIYSLLHGDESELSRDDGRHPSNEARALIGASHDPGAKGRGWLAISAGKALGLITTKDYSGGVVVDPAYRRQGIAEALVRAREDFMLAHGQTEARSDIRADNVGSLLLFTKLGYHFDDASKAVIDRLADPSIAPNANKVPVLVLTKNLVEEGLLARWRKTTSGGFLNPDAFSPSGAAELAEAARLAEEKRREEEQDRDRVRKLEDRLRPQVSGP